jgi:hypothetical protein
MPKRCGYSSRAAARSRVKDDVYPQSLGGGDQVVSLAFRRLCRARTLRGALAWLGGFRAGFDGAPYVWPLGTLDPQMWAFGFIEGRGYRGRA